jgi:Uma2 family endonuclease
MATDAAQGTVLRGITWKTYLKLRDNETNYHTRMTYLDGTLILTSSQAEGAILRGITWKTYVKLRDNENNFHTRMSYLDGTLILMSPEYLHDRHGWKLALVVSEVTEALRIPCQGTATTTLRRPGPGPKKGTGKEPDYGFYFRENDLRMRNKDEINLDVDPPPDLAIEIDHKADSTKALKLHARLGIPEVWRYKTKKKTLWFGRLAGETYETIERSLNLPKLTPTLVLRALDEAKRLGESDWKPWLRDWARDLPEAPVNP